MTQPRFGITIRRDDSGPRPAITSDMSTIGLVIAANNPADPAAWPVNTPVLVNSLDDIELGAAGSHLHQVDLINAQLTAAAASARLVIVRVMTGADDAATMTNLIAGLDGLLEAESLLGVTPRLVAIPGYTHQQTSPQTANPVVAALHDKLERLHGVAVVTGPHTSLGDYTSWRETISSDRLIPVETWVKVGTAPDVVDSAGAVLGMLVARDAAGAGVPSASAANRAMQGIVGPNREIVFSITDGATEGQQILALNGGIIVRGSAGSASSLGDGGFIFVGTDTASDDALWRFYTTRRVRDYIHLLFLRTLRDFLGRFRLTTQTIEAVRATMVTALRDLEAAGHILGFRVSFDPDANTPGNLRLGRFSLQVEAEESPILTQLDITSRRYAPALDALLGDLIETAQREG